MFYDNKNIITSTYLNTLDEELRELIYYLDEICGKKIINNIYFTKIRFEDDRSALALFELANFLYNKFYTDELRNAFEIEDYFKYRKMLDISDNLLFVKDNRYFDAFIRLVHTDLHGLNQYSREEEKYIKLNEFFKKFSLESDLSDKLIRFLNEYDTWTVLKRKNEKPITLEQELKYLKDINEDKISDDYIEFSGIKNIEKNMKTTYINKKIGNIGELYTLDYMLDQGFTVRHVAHEVSDGLGFDILAFGRNEKEFPEIVIDSKATTNPYSRCFSLTNNEFNVLCDCDSSFVYHYFISRVLVDIDKGIVDDHQMLSSKLCNHCEFSGIYDKSLEYEINNSKSDDKKKVYTWKQ